MKIAELFIALGFQVEGGDKLPQVDRNLNKASISALGLLAAVTALNAAFYAMMNRAIDTAVGLDKFDRVTGGLANYLQRWEYAARRANVATGTVGDAIKQIQKTRSEMALGNVDASSPWFLLGIDPRQDPLKVLAQLKGALSSMDPALARTMTQRMGFSDELLYLLQQKTTLGSLFVSQDDVRRLTELGGAWKALTYNLSIVTTKFAAAFADKLATIVHWLERGVLLLDRFVRWINSGTAAANFMRTVLVGLVIVLGLVGLALAGIVGLLGLLKGALVAVQLVPIVAALTGVILVVAALAAGLLFLILMIEDFWTAVDGGKSLFQWNDGLLLTIRNVERLANLFERIKNFMAEIRGNQDYARELNSGLGKEYLKYVTGYGVARDFINWNWRQNAGGGAGGNNTKVDIHVDGSKDPITTGNEVGRSVRREISDAMGTAPIPTN